MTSDTMSDTLMVFSADSHVGPRMNDLREYCPNKYRSAFDEFAASEYADPAKNLALAAHIYSDEYLHGRSRNQRTAGHYDPHAFLADMDTDGVAGAAIFHQSLNGEVFPFDLTNSIGQGVPPKEAQELAGVGRRMYNRWLADFCAVAPERLCGLAHVPIWDIAAAIEELEWCADHGLAGTNFPAPGAAGMVQPDEAAFDPFFAACASLDMTLATHIGSSPPRPVSDQGVRLGDGLATLSFSLIDAGDWGTRTIYLLVISGAFERHPNLKLVVTEIPGVFWNEMAVKLDSVQFTPVRSKSGMLLRPPSEYLAENVWLANSFQSRGEAEAAIQIEREDRFLWGSDYPHAEGTYTYPERADQYPMTRLSLASTYHDLPLEKVRKLVGENALNAYPRLDGEAMRRVADRVGVTVREVSTVPDLDAHPHVKDSGSLGFRTLGPWS